MKNLFTVSFLVLLAASYAEIIEEDGVLVLNDSNFDETIRQNEYILVEFYAPWCGHCKSLAPEYALAARELKGRNSQIKLAKVDATIETGLSSRYQVNGFPTIKFFFKGEPLTYDAGYKKMDVIDWLQRKMFPVIFQTPHAEYFEDLISANNIVVAFWVGKDHSFWDTFEIISKKFGSEVQFTHTTLNNIKEIHGITPDNLVTIFKKYDDRVVEYNGEISIEAITNFIKDQQYPTIMGFDQTAAQKIFSDSQPALFLLVDGNEKSQRASYAFRSVGQKLKGKLYLSIANIDQGLGGKLAEFLGVSREQLPVIRLIKNIPDANPIKYTFQKEITPENIYEFVDAFQSGRLTASLKSEPIPETQNGPVTIVVGNNFQKIVLNDEDDVLIEFYAPWCGHCKTLAPHFDEVGKRLAKVKNLVIAKCDATANEIESVQIQGYPTIKFYPAGKKNSPIDYNGERTADGIVEWLKKNTVGAKFPEASGEL